MITPLDNSEAIIAKQIFIVFQNAYKIEAQLINVKNFPPLSRSLKNIQHAKTQFYGFIENKCLAAVIEISIQNKSLSIDSVTVDPLYFKKGIATKLIVYVLEALDFSTVIVETAIANVPAINLYEKLGFIEFKRWTPSHGIPKLAMSIKHNA